jgi:hypothetical protein
MQLHWPLIRNAAFDVKQTRGMLCRALYSVDTAIEAGLAVQPSVIMLRHGIAS